MENQITTDNTRKQGSSFTLENPTIAIVIVLTALYFIFNINKRKSG